MLEYFEAKKLADQIVEAITPFCHRCEIAGSLRRRRPVVKDIEVVAIPKWEDRPDTSDLFGEMKETNALYADWANRQDRIQWIKPGVDKVIPWWVNAEGKYWRGLLHEGIKLDLFLTTPECWPVIYTIRTGCADFSQELVTYAKLTRRTPVEKGRILNYGRPVELADERAVFDYLALEWVEPEQRTGKEALRPKG
jgi:DNA polymerase/3'-5' exonuclease PolX